MTDKTKTGIISGIGLILIDILMGILLILKLNFSHQNILFLILQISYLTFTLYMWKSLRHVLAFQYRLADLKKNLDWIVKSLSILIGVYIFYKLVSTKESYFLIIVADIILYINYLLMYKKIFELDKFDINAVNDLHNYLLSVIICSSLVILSSMFSPFLWQRKFDYISYFLRAIPTVFLVIFFKHINGDIQKAKYTSA
jgi:hypothetical protein